MKRHDPTAPYRVVAWIWVAAKDDTISAMGRFAPGAALAGVRSRRIDWLTTSGLLARRMHRALLNWPGVRFAHQSQELVELPEIA